MIRKNLTEYNSNEASIVTIGTFDGVHIGHKKIINQLIEFSKLNGLRSILLSFFPHPKMILQNNRDIKLINTIEEKEFLLNQLDLNFLIINEFTKAFSRLSAVEFVRDILVNKLNAKHIIIGYDHHFGRNRTAGIDQLKEFGELYDFKVSEIAAQDLDNVSISSTKIRNALCKGEISIANKYLGYNYFFSGLVVKGNSIGKSISFPTANIRIQESYKLIPQSGVYIVMSSIDSRKYYGMMNIGTNPTFSNNKESIEVHFLEMDKDLYDKKIRVSILYRIRDEKKFDNINLLRNQLLLDKKYTIRYINDLNI